MSTVNTKPYPYGYGNPEYQNEADNEFKDYSARDSSAVRNYASYGVSNRRSRRPTYSNDDIMEDTLNPRMSPYDVHSRIKESRHDYYW